MKKNEYKCQMFFQESNIIENQMEYHMNKTKLKPEKQILHRLQNQRTQPLLLKASMYQKNIIFSVVCEEGILFMQHCYFWATTMAISAFQSLILSAESNFWGNKNKQTRHNHVEMWNQFSPSKDGLQWSWIVFAINNTESEDIIKALALNNGCL